MAQELIAATSKDGEVIDFLPIPEDMELVATDAGTFLVEKIKTEKST
jgi:hypothetical protein